jgi:hypothetical protein
MSVLPSTFGAWRKPSALTHGAGSPLIIPVHPIEVQGACRAAASNVVTLAALAPPRGEFDDHALTLIEPSATRNTSFWGRNAGRSLPISTYRGERRQQPMNPAEVMLPASPDLLADDKFDWNAVFQQSCAPFAGAGGDQQSAGHGIR